MSFRHLNILLICLILQFSISQPAFAFLGIPGTPSIPLPICDPLECARKAERIAKCNQIRDDANMHQASISRSLADLNQNLRDETYALTTSTQRRDDLEQRKASLAKQDALLTQFQDLNKGLIFSEATLRQGLSNIQSSASAQSLNEILSSMEADPSHPEMTQLAGLLRNMTSKSSVEINELLSSNQGRSLIQQMSVLIGTAQIMLAEEKSHNAASITQANDEINYHSSRVNQLNSSINQLNGDWSAQEERKSCRF